MSYKRKFTRTICVEYSGSVSYPASETGGFKSYSGHVYEDVEFIVEVDTDPFEESIKDMKESVDLVTGSVVATKAAHVKSIYDTSKQVGDTIIAGFFKTVKSDISQQITELKTKTDALLVQLHELAKRCNDKRRQMGNDYQRICSRYGKLFNDLNRELENRIHAIDEPIFKFQRKTSELADRQTGDSMVATASVTAGENARVRSMISASLAKKDAANALRSSERFLAEQYRTDVLLDACLRDGGESTRFATPFMVMETTDTGGVRNTQIYSSPMLQHYNQQELCNRMESRKWDTPVADDSQERISEYYKSEVAGLSSAAQTDHDRRVAELTGRLFNLSNTAAPGK